MMIGLIMIVTRRNCAATSVGRWYVFRLASFRLMIVGHE